MYIGLWYSLYVPIWCQTMDANYSNSSSGQIINMPTDFPYQ